MISEKAIKSVNSIFAKAAMANLAINGSDNIEVSQLSDAKLEHLPGKGIVVLTISSYLFRLLILFHINPDESTKRYFTKSDCDQEFFEVFGEHGNLCVGEMNRDLGNHFLHLGMSTPYALESKCAPFISELNPSYLSHHRIGINGDIALHATLCLCAYAPLDFHYQVSETIEETGELELF